jgi:hypothetical protein
MNGGNNKSIMKKWATTQEVKPWMNSYCSTSWIIWRGPWFFEFLAEIMKLFCN